MSGPFRTVWFSPWFICMRTGTSRWREQMETLLGSGWWLFSNDDYSIFNINSCLWIIPGPQFGSSVGDLIIF